MLLVEAWKFGLLQFGTSFSADKDGNEQRQFCELPWA